MMFAILGYLGSVGPYFERALSDFVFLWFMKSTGCDVIYIFFFHELTY